MVEVYRDGDINKYTNEGSRLGIIKYILHPLLHFTKISLLEKQ